MLYVFIDTNIYLDFYHFSDEDLNALGSLNKLVRETTAICLYVTSQVIDEFNRNRENKIADALKQFDNLKIDIRIPVLCDGYGETKTIRQAIGTFNENKKSLLARLNEDIKIKPLKLT